jgi:NhaP-type Na+/H+ or K+/H+ antiporter
MVELVMAVDTAARQFMYDLLLGAAIGLAIGLIFMGLLMWWLWERNHR